MKIAYLWMDLSGLTTTSSFKLKSIYLEFEQRKWRNNKTRHKNKKIMEREAERKSWILHCVGSNPWFPPSPMENKSEQKRSARILKGSRWYTRKRIEGNSGKKKDIEPHQKRPSNPVLQLRLWQQHSTKVFHPLQ